MADELVSFLVVIVAMVFLVVEGKWSNSLGGMLSRSCMYGFGISSLRSEYQEGGGDRFWEIKCTKIGLLRGDDVCIWTYDFVNDAGKDIDYNCKEKQYIAGLYSDYNRTASDRVWRIECCESPGIVVTNCKKSEDWANRYTNDLNLQLKPNQVIQGITSVYKAEKRDRKWRFTICETANQSTEVPTPPDPDES